MLGIVDAGVKGFSASGAVEIGEALHEGLAPTADTVLEHAIFARRLRGMTWLFCYGIGPESEVRPAVDRRC